MIYLCSPYSSPDPEVRERRFRDTCRLTAALMREGMVVFSPIAHSHPLVEHGLPTDWEFWKRFDQTFLERCDEVVVLMMEGWRESVGVQAEIRLACELGKPIRYLDPKDPAKGSPTLAHVAAEEAG